MPVFGTKSSSEYKTMPGPVVDTDKSSHPAGHFSKTLGVPEPKLQRKKRVESPTRQALTDQLTDMEPSLQRKKRPGQGPPMKPMNEQNIIPSKKRVTGPASEKTAKDEVGLQARKKVAAPNKEPTIQSEPPLQSKRRSQGPPTTLTTNYYNKYAQDDFTLLGNQSKFAQNVKYKLRSSSVGRDSSPPKQPKLSKTSQYKENVAPRPAPIVNTDQFKKPPTPLAPRKPKEQSDPLIAKVKAQVDRELKASHHETRKVEKPKSKVEVKRSEEKMADKNLNCSADYVKEPLKDKKIGNMNEFTQTNMEKGVADSAPEAPADYALKFKTGVAPPRATKKVSEYQKQFQWKAGMRPSPLLKAEMEQNPEKVVYNNNPQLSPPKKDVVPKMSEYQRQYHPFRLSLPLSPDDQVIPQKPAKKKQLKKSKSMEDLAPTEIKPAGSAAVIAPDNQRLTMESERKDKNINAKAIPQVPKARTRVYRTEYVSNFKPPIKFDYVQGAWHGASPPHLAMSVPEGGTTSAPALSNWFAEVLELRRKAREYGIRSQGTHFSREHLVQLMAKQTDMWDASTATATARSCPSTVSAVSGESAKEDHKWKRESRKEEYARKVQEMESTAATIDSQDDQSTARLSEPEQPPPAQKKLAWTESPAETPSSYDDYEDGEGRITTPKLREMMQQKGNARRSRHHLARTTPAVGGAILSSPPRAEKRKLKPKPGKPVSRSPLSPEQTPPKQSASYSQASPTEAEADGYMSDDTLTEAADYRPLAGQKTYTASEGPLAPSPTLGMPTRDSHFLRDYEADSDRALTTKYVDSPAKAQKRQEGDLFTIDEGYGQTYSKAKADVVHKGDMYYTYDGGMKILRKDPDDDVLSISARSVASSCSLASEVLERARKRKEEFWGKDGISAK